MTAVRDRRHPSCSQGAAWRVEPSGSTFELEVSHVLGPSRVVGTFGHVDGLLRRDPAGDIRIGFAIEVTSLVVHGRQGESRSRSLRRFVGRGAGRLVVFESTHVTEDGPSHLHVVGRLVAGARRVPVELDVGMTRTARGLEIEGTTTVDHRQLGVDWIPGGVPRAPTELVVRASLIPVADVGEEALSSAIALRPGPARRARTGSPIQAPFAADG